MAPDARGRGRGLAQGWRPSLRASRRTGSGSMGVPQAWPALPRWTALRAAPQVALPVSRAARSVTAQKPAQPERLRAFGLARVPGLAEVARVSGMAGVTEVAGVAGVAATSQAVKLRPWVSQLQAPRARPLHPR